MGSATVNTAMGSITNSIPACQIIYSLQYYDTSSNSWLTASAGSPSYIASAGMPNSGDFDVSLDGVDADSISYRPETSIDYKFVANLPDSIATATLTTIEDLFTITIQDECIDD